jgi:flagellar basal-body rod protein FlgB
MTLSDVPFLSALRERMSWLNARQTLLSQNVANADTPGYAARDLKPMDFQSELQRHQPSAFAGMAVTDTKHIVVPGSGREQSEDGTVTQTETTETGNSVSLEEEMMKVADTQAQYQAAANLYSKAVGMMRTAIGSA